MSSKDEPGDEGERSHLRGEERQLFKQQQLQRLRAQQQQQQQRHRLSYNSASGTWQVRSAASAETGTTNDRRSQPPGTVMHSVTTTNSNQTTTSRLCSIEEGGVVRDAALRERRVIEVCDDEEDKNSNVSGRSRGKNKPLARRVWGFLKSTVTGVMTGSGRNIENIMHEFVSKNFSILVSRNLLPMSLA